MSFLARGILLLVLALLLHSSATAATEDQEERQKEEEGRVLQRAGAEEGKGPPRNLTAEGVSGSAIEVSWFPPEETPPHYKVRCDTCPIMEEVTVSTDYRMEGLDACRDYDFTVFSYYSSDTSFHEDTSGSTLSSTPAPESCSITDVTSEEFRVEWTKPDTYCSLRDYNVSWTWKKLWGDGEEGSGSLVTSLFYVDVVNSLLYTNYSIEIFAFTADGVPGPPCSCSAVTPGDGDGKGPPQNLIAEGVSKSAIKVSWSHPEEIPKHYEVQCPTCPTTEELTNNTHYLMEGLDACEDYYFTITSQYSDTTFAEDTSSSTLCSSKGPPQDLIAKGVSESAIKVSWSHPEERPEYYRVQCPTCPTAEEQTNNTHYLMEGLDACESYNFTVTSQYSDTTFSEVTSSSTLCSNKGPPQNLTAEGVSESAIEVSWSHPKEIPEYYEVQCPTCSLDEWITNTHYLMEGLDACRSYNFTVTSHYGDTNFSEDTSGSTLSIISEMKCVTEGPHQVSVEWQLQDPLCSVSGYNLSWSTHILWPTETEENANGTDISEESTTYALFGLTPYSNVSVCVRIKESSGSGVCCSSITDQDVPSEPTQVKVAEKNSSSISLHWSLPEQLNGVLTGWLLTLPSSNSMLEDPAQNWFLIVDLLPSTEYTVCVRAKTVAGAGGCGKLVARTDDEDNDSYNPNVGLIVGASVGGVALLALVVASGLIFYRTSNKAKQHKDPRDESYTANRERNGTTDFINKKHNYQSRPSPPFPDDGIYPYYSQPVNHSRPWKQPDGRQSMYYSRQPTKREQMDYGWPQSSHYSSHHSQQVNYSGRSSQQVDHGWHQSRYYSR